MGRGHHAPPYVEFAAMKQKILTLAVVLVLPLLVGAAAAPLAQAQTIPGIIYVPDDYPTIQGAVDAAAPGDTIIIRDGSYTENIIVTTDHLTIRSENGAVSTVVVAADPDANVFNITADYVSIAGLTVTGATEKCRAGINLTESSYCDICDNTAIGNYQGICLKDSHHNTLTGNTANENDYFGIRLYYSPLNTLRNNSMERNVCNFYSWSRTSLKELRQDADTSNKVDGKPIYLLLDKSDLVIDSSTNAGYVAVINSTNITVRDLNITHSGHGVLFAYTNNSRIENVTGCYDKHSFQLFRSHNNVVIGNLACNNIYDGFRIWNSTNNVLLNNTSKGNRNGAFLHCSDNTLTNHTAISNHYGIYLEGPSNNNTLTHCSFVANHFGIFSRGSVDNSIYLNELVNNTLNVFSFGLGNIWESPQRLIYTYNGSDYTGRLGNYWGDYESKYPDAEEIDSTGVWDTPYGIRVSAPAVPQDDNCPLVAPASHYLVTGSIPAEPSWLSRYWWAIVAVAIIAVLLVCFLKKSKSKG